MLPGSKTTLSLVDPDPDPGKDSKVDPDPGKVIEVDPDPDPTKCSGSGWIRLDPNPKHWLAGIRYLANGPPYSTSISFLKYIYLTLLASSCSQSLGQQ